MKHKKILIVKLNKLGDTITFLPTIEVLRKSWHEDYLTLLTTDAGREVVEGSELVDRIWTSTINEIKTFRGFFRWLKIIRKNRFDIAMASSDSSSFVALLFFMSAIPVKVGFTNPKLSFLFNVKKPFLNEVSHVRLNLLLAEQLGYSMNCARPKVDIPEEDKKIVLNILKEYGIKELDRFIVIHLGSDRLRPSQRWPLERFADLTNYLWRTYSIKIVFIGSFKEKEQVSLIFRNLYNKDCCIDLLDRTSIKQLIYIISSATLFIGHPSGPLQIAYLAGTPSVSFWGASSLSNWGPVWDKEKHICIQANLDCIGCEQTKCSRGTFECINLITVDMVIKEIPKLLDRVTSPRL